MLSCLGALVILLGRVVFALLEPTCGPEGHRVCYEDCPMSGGAVGLHDICHSSSKMKHRGTIQVKLFND